MRTWFSMAALLLAACEAKSSAGAALYASQACATCHGQTGAGGPFGPSLRGKGQHWTRESLVLYLKDPIAYAAKDPRLSEQAKRFTLPMQRFDKLKPEELEAVADYVLAMQ